MTIQDFQNQQSGTTYSHILPGTLMTNFYERQINSSALLLDYMQTQCRIEQQHFATSE
jgi:hypothetical protein